jgi:formate dehydrogenase subunit delta
MSPDRLIYMANQIGKFFESQGGDKAVPGIADHIRKFWDPRMRKAIFAHLDTGGSGLDPVVRDALETLKKAALTNSNGFARNEARQSHGPIQTSKDGRH